MKSRQIAVWVLAGMFLSGLGGVSSQAQQVGTAITSDGAAPNANAMLDVQSPATGDGKGLLIPRITEAQRITASAVEVGGLLDNAGALRGGAAQGLLVYQTDGTPGFYYNTSGTAMPSWSYVSDGDFMADGSVPMSGNLNLGGQNATNGSFVGDGSGLTGIPASAITEADPLWNGVSNAIMADISSRLASNVWAAADSTTNYASRVDWAATNSGLQAQIDAAGTGDFKADGSVAMTGNLNMNGRNISGVASNIAFTGDEVIIGKNATADSGFDGVAIGSAAHGDYMGVGVGYQANGLFAGSAVGYLARAYYYGSALGYEAFATNFGVAVGKSANGISSGAAVGADASGQIEGAALGYAASGEKGGVAVGYSANGLEGGIAIGYDANGIATNIAIGQYASTHDPDHVNGGDRIAIGREVTNKTENSCAIRGTLYLDGGTGVLYRSTFGNGAWTALGGGGGGGISSYGYVYDRTVGGQTVAGNDNVFFSTNGPLSGCTHTAGETTFTVPNTGTYKVEYSVTITAGLGSQIAVAVNDVPDASTCVDVPVAVGNISGTAMMTLTAGDELTLRNNSMIPFTTTASPGVGAQITITQLN